MPRIGRYAKPRVRDLSSEAYQSKDKDKFRTKLTVEFDFSSATRSLRAARRALEDLNYDAKQLSKKLKKTDKGYGIYITADMVRSRGAEGNQLISFDIPGLDNEAEFSASLRPFLTEIGKMGKDIMKNKYATRRETGLLNSSVAYMQRRSGKNKAIVEIGWIRTWQKYFGWQEQGTSRGIKPMAAILRTRFELEKEIQPTYSKYFRKTFLEKNR